MSLQEESRQAGRTILTGADPNCQRCKGSGWYMVGMGGDFDDCDCLQREKQRPDDQLSEDQP